MKLRTVPVGPVELDEVIERWPTVRQSMLSNFDDCALSAYFSIRHLNGWSTSAQARGTILHRAFAEILQTMCRQGMRTIPVSEALQVLIEVCRQQTVPAEDIVRVPLRMMPELRMAVTKFAKDNEFSTDKIVDIERRLEAVVPYVTPAGEVIERKLTGKLDVLLFEPPDGAVVIDWKTGFGMPPEPRESDRQGFDDEELKGLSYLGYFQQRVYGTLVLLNYANVERVTLREFWPYHTAVRKATLHRHQLPEVIEELSVMVQAFDSAVMQGAPNLKPDDDGLVDIEGLGWWRPSPGKHCVYCAKPTACPIEEDVRVANEGAVTSLESASRWAARRTVAGRIRDAATEGLKGYVEDGGAPVPVKWSKGRQVIGWYQTKRGRRFGEYVPDQSDRGGHADLDAQLAEAMRESTARARAERGAKPRRPRRAA